MYCGPALNPCRIPEPIRTQYPLSVASILCPILQILWRKAVSKFSILSLVMLVVLAVVGFRGDARADKQLDDNNPKPGKGERYCPVHPSDEEVAAMENDFAARKAEKSFSEAE